MRLTEPMRRIVEDQKLGFVATVNEDGSPNLSPKGSLAVWDDRTLVFADLASPGTVRNLRRRPLAEVNVVDPFARRGYRFRVRGTVLGRGPVWAAGLRFFGARGIVRPGERIHHVVLLELLAARAMRSPGYDLGYREATMRRRWSAYYARLARGERSAADPAGAPVRRGRPRAPRGAGPSPGRGRRPRRSAGAGPVARSR